VLIDIRYLVDSSAIVRLVCPGAVEVLSPLIKAGQLATCAVVDLDLALVCDSSGVDEIRELRAAAFAWLTTEDADLRRALEVQRLLASDGHHPIAWAALVVAAVAERHRVAVLHGAAVFDRIAEVTGQPVRWILPEREVS
jgi:hypothetical protein